MRNLIDSFFSNFSATHFQSINAYINQSDAVSLGREISAIDDANQNILDKLVNQLQRNHTHPVFFDYTILIVNQLIEKCSAVHIDRGLMRCFDVLLNINTSFENIKKIESIILFYIKKSRSLEFKNTDLFLKLIQTNRGLIFLNSHFDDFYLFIPSNSFDELLQTLNDSKNNTPIINLALKLIERFDSKDHDKNFTYLKCQLALNNSLELDEKIIQLILILFKKYTDLSCLDSVFLQLLLKIKNGVLNNQFKTVEIMSHLAISLIKTNLLADFSMRHYFYDVLALINSQHIEISNIIILIAVELVGQLQSAELAASLFTKLTWDVAGLELLDAHFDALKNFVTSHFFNALVMSAHLAATETKKMIVYKVYSIASKIISKCKINLSECTDILVTALNSADNKDADGIFENLLFTILVTRQLELTNLQAEQIFLLKQKLPKLKDALKQSSLTSFWTRLTKTDSPSDLGLTNRPF